MRTQVRSLASFSGLRLAENCDVGRRCGSDLVLLWLWCRPAATALIRPLAWEPPYVVEAAQEIAKKKKKEREVMSVAYNAELDGES